MPADAAALRAVPRRPRKPFGPRERWALVLALWGVIFCVVDFIHVSVDIANDAVDFDTALRIGFCVLNAYVVKWSWPTLKAWWKSGDE